MAFSSTKKRKISDFSEDQLFQTFLALKKFRATIQHVEAEEDASSDVDDNDLRPEEAIEQHTLALLNLIERKMTGIKIITFSNVTQETLRQMNVTFAGDLRRISSGRLENLTKQSKALGMDKCWSSKQMYDHLQTLEELVPRTAESAARLWIDTFLFRVSAIIPPQQCMILTIEHICEKVQAKPTADSYLTGRIDYTAVIAKAADADPIRHSVRIDVLKDKPHSGFFVLEGKLNLIATDIPQAIAEMYACAKHLRKDICRGALTNGTEWIFLILYLNANGEGATYKQSPLVSLTYETRVFDSSRIKEPGPDVIAGILSCWIQRSFSDLGDDDWFEHPTVAS